MEPKNGIFTSFSYRIDVGFLVLLHCGESLIASLIFWGATSTLSQLLLRWAGGAIWVMWCYDLG